MTGGFSLIQTYAAAAAAAAEIQSTCRAFPSFFQKLHDEGAVHRSNSPLIVKHKVFGSQRGNPTFFSFTAIPVALKEML